jgi:hypothetical protein
VRQEFAHRSAVCGDDCPSLSDLAPDPILLANLLHWWQEAVAPGEDRCQWHRKRCFEGALEFDRNRSRLLDGDRSHHARIPSRARQRIPCRAETSRPAACFVTDTSDMRGEVLEERSKLTADLLVGNEPVVTDHRMGDGHLCAGVFDDPGGGVAKNLAQ